MKTIFVRVVNGDIMIPKADLSEFKPGSYVEISLAPVFVDESVAAKFPKGFNLHET
jgi:hypothetical protein